MLNFSQYSLIAGLMLVVLAVICYITALMIGRSVRPAPVMANVGARAEGGGGEGCVPTAAGRLRAAPLHGPVWHLLLTPRLGLPYCVPGPSDHLDRPWPFHQPVRVRRGLRLGDDRRLRLLRAPLPRAHHRPAGPADRHRDAAVRPDRRGTRQPAGAGAAEQPAANHPRRGGNRGLRRILGLFRGSRAVPDPAR